jgi:hypothetical protein
MNRKYSAQAGILSQKGFLPMQNCLDKTVMNLDISEQYRLCKQPTYVMSSLGWQTSFLRQRGRRLSLSNDFVVSANSEIGSP